MARDTRSYTLTYLDLNNHENDVVIDKFPDECPVCGKGVEVKPLSAYGKTEDNPFRGEHFVQAIFRCPKVDCQCLFIGTYTGSSGSAYTRSEYVFLRGTTVSPYTEHESFDDEVEKLSPHFVTIYTQAKGAEDNGFNLICGAGYRRALEFLIKDYLIALKPDEEAVIKEKRLGWLIVHKVDDPRIKTTAGLAKDVGNDETHYEKKLDELTLEDMKKLVKLTQYWIVSEIMTKGYAEKTGK